jgi:hypothetical protein
MEMDRRRAIGDLLLEWEDRFADGVDVSAADLAREHPDLVAELDRRIRALKALLWLERPGRDVPAAVSVAGSAEPPPPLAGRYRLDERIGVGGFAEVWKGFDLQLQRIVAVKVAKATAVQGDESFLAEARRVAAFQHPGIVTVHDVGQDGDRWFIVSEFVPGGSLAARLARGPVSRVDAVRWVMQVAAALDAAHRAGLVHRDVKPENILLNAAGDTLLADFGIASATGPSAESSAGTGTLRSMAPEQLQGRPVTPASDVYALGLVLHEALAGHLPFRSTSANGIRGEITAGVADRVAMTIPRPLATVCRRALAVEPCERFQTAGAFAAALRRAAGSPRRWLMSGGVFVLGVAAAIAAWSRPARRAGPEATGTVAILPSGRVPMLDGGDATGRIVVRFAEIDGAGSHVVEAFNVRLYREWQTPPLSYVGPAADGVEGRVVYRFDAPRPIAAARLLGTVFCTDFTTEPGGIGRGAAAVDVSGDGVAWSVVRDGLSPGRWGDRYELDGPLPERVLGGRSLWVRVRLLTHGSPNVAYTTAQFGREFFGDLGCVFGVDLDLRGAAN